MTKHQENRLFMGGPSGARSRDLRIKRPHGQQEYYQAIAQPCALRVAYNSPRATHLCEVGA